MRFFGVENVVDSKNIARFHRYVGLNRVSLWSLGLVLLRLTKNKIGYVKCSGRYIKKYLLYWVIQKVVIHAGMNA